jgi:NIPSNAP
MTPSTLATTLTLSALALAALAPAPAARAQDSRAFELRIYTAEDGKLEALHRRFRDHTIGLFKKHGMEVIGFWVPTADDAAAANTLVYVMAYPSQEARDASWKAFVDDPEWKAVYAESHKDGPLVKKVESRKLDPTDYSPLK